MSMIRDRDIRPNVKARASKSSGNARETVTPPSKRGVVLTGKVASYNTNKGWGFISPADGSKDVFVHKSDVAKANMPTLPPGMELCFELSSYRDQPRAINLHSAPHR